jgi:hypothetical protein
MVFFNDKPLRGTLTSIGESEYEKAYLDAYDRALDLLDKGIEQRDLMQAFDAEVLHAAQPPVVSMSSGDDGDEIYEHPLADPPLDLTGLPSLGKPDARAPVPVVLLCRPNEAMCYATMRILRNVHSVYRGEIRLVWAPWFDVTMEDAAELGMLGDAALCAERVGSSPDDLDSSPGWQWVTEALAHYGRIHGRKIAPDKLIDNVAAKLHIDSKQLSACRARIANATFDWIARARRSGVIASPAIVIGGRIYHGLAEQSVIQQLVEAELAPGVLGRCATTGC